MWRGQPNEIPNDDARRRYIERILSGDRQNRDVRTPHGDAPPPDPAPDPDTSPVWFRMGPDSPWQYIGRAGLPPSLPHIDPVRSSDGTILRQAFAEHEERMRRMQESFARFAEVLEALPVMELPQLDVQRGGIRYGEVPTRWDISAYQREDPRQGEEVYVYDLLPGLRVYVLEDVFTVDRVDMNAPLPTVWLKELPTSPLYFSEDEYIYLANESEEQP